MYNETPAWVYLLLLVVFLFMLSLGYSFVMALPR